MSTEKQAVTPAKVQPEEPVRFTISLPPSIRADGERRAKEVFRNFNGYVAWLISEDVSRAETVQAERERAVFGV